MIRYDIDNCLSDSIIFLGTKVSIYVITKNYSLQPMHKVFLFLMKTKKRMLCCHFIYDDSLWNQVARMTLRHCVLGTDDVIGCAANCIVLFCARAYVSVEKS